MFSWLSTSFICLSPAVLWSLQPRRNDGRQPSPDSSTGMLWQPQCKFWPGLTLLLLWSQTTQCHQQAQHMHSTAIPTHLCKSTKMLGRRFSFWAPNFASALTAARELKREMSEVLKLYANTFSQSDSKHCVHCCPEVPIYTGFHFHTINLSVLQKD